MAQPLPKRPRVALLIESSRAYGRGLLAGIAAYVRTHRPWSIYHQERTMADAAPRWLSDFDGDGVIARLESKKLVEQIQALKLPTVDLRGLHDLPGVPLIETDDRAVVQRAVEHFTERGFEHLAFCGFAGANYSQRRLKYFHEQLQQLGFTPHVYEGSPDMRFGDTAAIEARGLLHEDEIARWIDALPKPVGLIACNDVRGQQALSACRTLGVAVPDEVAVLGVDDDAVICDLCDPPLSSVAPNTEKIGYAAAAMLEAMMTGQAPEPKKTFIEPIAVVTRQSTDALAIADRQIAAAVRYIREHAADGISVEDVLEQTRLSRSTLERRFAKLLGRSPKAEIIRVQMDRVKQLLRETDFTLPKIASFTGFKHPEYMCAMFKQKTGQTPGEYRRAANLTDDDPANTARRLATR